MLNRRVKVRPSETKRGQERLTKKLEQRSSFPFSSSPNMKKPDVACSSRTNSLLWVAPKLSHPAAYGRLWQVMAGE
jgi:hypothetical protein